MLRQSEKENVKLVSENKKKVRKKTTFHSFDYSYDRGKRQGFRDS